MKATVVDGATARRQAIEVPPGLYDRAVRQLLANAPLEAMSGGESATGSLSEGEAAALAGVGLSMAPWHGTAAHDPLAQTVADYMALLETSLATGEVASLLKVDASRVRQRLREGSLLGIEDDGERRLPRFQFERGRVLPGLREVLPALPRGLPALDVAQWFLSSSLELEVRGKAVSPRQWLLSGGAVEAVVQLALGFE